VPDIHFIAVSGLKKYFEVSAGIFFRRGEKVHAVDNVDFHITKGETLGLAGESGCGKTTVGLLLLRLIEPTAGEVHFDGQNIFELTANEMRKLRPRMQIIFQDPYSSLNPWMTAGTLIGEPLKIQGFSRDDLKERVIDLMNRVGLSPEEHFHTYPHEFSAGQRQRIMIARALATKPDFIVADEPVSSLDVSVRAQVLNLLRELKREFKLTLLLITHDLSTTKYMCDRIIVMYLGKLVEIAETRDIFTSPQHPYLQALLSAVPIPDPEVKRKRIILKGEIPSAINPPLGCRFHTRCPFRKGLCEKVEPKLINLGKGHYVACHLMEES
jgi:oligopeptide/dipeptide ABC transporter ATP-binding protein